MGIIEHRVAGPASPPLRAVTNDCAVIWSSLKSNSGLQFSQDNRPTALEAASHLHCLTKNTKLASQHLKTQAVTAAFITHAKFCADKTILRPLNSHQDVLRR
jgi:hypothetical protein